LSGRSLINEKREKDFLSVINPKFSHRHWGGRRGKGRREAHSFLISRGKKIAGLFKVGV